MILSASSLLAFAQAAVPVVGEAQLHPRIAYVPVIEGPAEPAAPPPPVIRAIAPLEPATDTALGEDGVRIGKVDLFKGGKLLLTNGVTTVEGSSGGGIARWATIGGRQMPSGIGASAHATAIELADFGWRSYGVALGLGDRLELSISRADFDTRAIGAVLGIGRGYTLNLETFGAKVRVVGDLVYGEGWLPQIAVGIEHKHGRDGALVRALGAAGHDGTDYTVSATKLLLARSLLLNATLRYSEANELGLLGFGSAAGAATSCNSKVRWATSCRAARSWVPNTAPSPTISALVMTTGWTSSAPMR